MKKVAIAVLLTMSQIAGCVFVVVPEERVQKDCDQKTPVTPKDPEKCEE